MYFQVPNVILSKSKTTTIIRTGTNVIKSNRMHVVMTDAQTLCDSPPFAEVAGISSSPKTHGEERREKYG